MHINFIPRFVIFIFVCGAVPATAAPTFFTDVAAFNSALSQLPPHQLLIESFEDDGAWGTVRSTITQGQATAPEIISQGISWQSNFSAGEITTGNGPARTGDWGFYAIPHGSYASPEPNTNCDFPGDCGDGFVATPESGVLYAIGGWIDTNTPPAKVGIFPNGYPYYGNQCDVEGIDCNDLSLGTVPQFIGIVDPEGFNSAEFRELEGKTEGSFEGDLKYIFADDFRVAISLTEVPTPSQIPIPFALTLILGACTIAIGLFTFKIAEDSI